MPCLSIKHERKVEEVMNISLKNEKALGYEISSIYEVIKFELNEAGVKVEKEGEAFVMESTGQRPSLRLNSPLLGSDERNGESPLSHHFRK